MSMFLQAALACDEGTVVPPEPERDPDEGLDDAERLRRETMRQRLETIRVRARREENVRKIEARRAAKDQEKAGASAAVEDTRIAENKRVKDALEAEKAAKEKARADAEEERARRLAARERRQVLEERYTAMIEDVDKADAALEEKVETFDADLKPFEDSFSFIDRIRIMNKRAVKLCGEKQLPVSMLNVYGLAPPPTGIKHRKFVRTDMSDEALKRVHDQFSDAQREKQAREVERQALLAEMKAIDEAEEAARAAAAVAKEAARQQHVIATAERVLEERDLQWKADDAAAVQALVKSALHPVDIFQRAVANDILEERYRDGVDVCERGTNHKEILDHFLALERAAVQSVEQVQRHADEMMSSKRLAEYHLPALAQ
eukprot:TRINITY_DN5341_c0_g1_i1.p1 TRINITY_DN5341_c0_g1~~TRINITY_DN5341_c0_g1_i1.p1  ORF type:complete len:402 (+),score=186.39 TRINITY_DN5341_c0_g1_i1:80-1207(+)